jgi:hypothetical protein
LQPLPSGGKATGTKLSSLMPKKPATMSAEKFVATINEGM